MGKMVECSRSRFFGGERGKNKKADMGDAIDLLEEAGQSIQSWWVRI
jgi:hypothetical protein